MKTNIANIVALLECQITSTGTDPLVKRMPESFNLLIVKLEYGIMEK